MLTSYERNEARHRMGLGRACLGLEPGLQDHHGARRKRPGMMDQTGWEEHEARCRRKKRFFFLQKEEKIVSTPLVTVRRN
jgi:hypothetical protein